MEIPENYGQKLAEGSANSILENWPWFEKSDYSESFSDCDDPINVTELKGRTNPIKQDPESLVATYLIKLFHDGSYKFRAQWTATFDIYDRSVNPEQLLGTEIMPFEDIPIINPDILNAMKKYGAILNSQEKDGTYTGSLEYNFRFDPKKVIGWTYPYGKDETGGDDPVMVFLNVSALINTFGRTYHRMLA